MVGEKDDGWDKGDAVMERWNTTSLAVLCELFTDGNWIETKDQSSSGIRLIQTGNIGNGEFKDRREKARWISPETFNHLKCQEIIPGDCLVSRLPDPVGRACIIPETDEKMITAVDCSILRFNSSIMLPKFFCYFSQSKKYIAIVESKCTGSTRQRISRKNLGTLHIPLPPLPEQKRIVAILDEVFACITKAVANAEKNLTNARELFSSYLNNVFTQKGEGWVEKRLGELGKIQTGSTPKTSQPDNFGNFIPFIKPGDFKIDGRIDYTNIGVSEKGLKGTRLINSGSVLMVCIGATIGKVGYNECDVAANQQINALTPFPDVSSKFVYYQMLTSSFQKAVCSNADKQHFLS